MTTWPGWENEFLNAAGILVTPPCRQFLTQWAVHATSPKCARNPIDLSHSVTGSNRCAFNTGINHSTYTYSTHAHAADAFNTELHQPFAKAILDALNTGNPYQPPANRNDVESALVSWGSVKYANAYANAGSGGGGAGGGGGGNTTAHAGWDQLRHGWEHKWPNSLHSTQRSLDAALRSLSRGRKVRH